MKLELLSTIVPKTTQELVSLVIKNRGIKHEVEFVAPKSPLEISLSEVGIKKKEVRSAVERLLVAKEKGEKIIVFGDYDCDGVCATTVLWETLYENGYKALPFIPSREHHGYGLSLKAIDEILSQGVPAVLISVDNGIVARDAWKRLGEAGVYRILTDHHESDGRLPEVESLIHTTKLCGTTVSWMLARELDSKKAESLLDLCALATIADQVPLTDANRSFAKWGLIQLNQTKRLGIKLLIEISGLTPGKITSYGVNFGLVPRINAMGRLGQAMDALRALCTKNSVKAQELVEKLSATNVERQDLTRDLVMLAMSRAQEWVEEKIIIVEDVQFHEGVIGLIAGKLTETFHKPSIVIAMGVGRSKASARSVPGVHITQLLRSVSEVLIDVGGHPLAAGFSIHTEKILELKQLLSKKTREIDDSILVPSLTIDCELIPGLVNIETAQALSKLEPFGQANRQPLFLLRDVTVTGFKLTGKDKRHLSLWFDLDGKSVSGIAFGKADFASNLENNPTCNLVAGLEINEWKGRSSAQLVVKDLMQDHVLT